jgi:hypothetical protein
MRDDFPTGVKEELAKRVGYLCSNPGCRQSTSGPQSKPSGTVNIGVAAHITAASPNGARYDSSLSSEQRAASANGILLCQTCAKLVDSDPFRYTVEKLREWKRDAEVTASQALERRGAPTTQSQGVFLEAERLMPRLIAQMREDVRSDEGQLIREFVVLSRPEVVFTGVKPRFQYFESEHPQLRLQVDWLKEMRMIVDVTPRDTPVYRMVPEFVDWLRVSTPAANSP